MKHEKQDGLGRMGLVLAGVFACMAPGFAVAQRPLIPEAPAPTMTQLPPKAADDLKELDEVLVIGGRLYDRIVRAEDKFFKMYNDLNKDDDFDTNCASVIMDSDSRIEQRFCMPVFFADAKAEQARLSQYCLSLALQETKDADGNITQNAIQGVCYEPPSAEQLFFARRDEYVDNMLAVINSHPELKKLAMEVEGLHRERAAVANRYSEIKAQEVSTRAEKNKNRPKIR